LSESDVAKRFWDRVRLFAMRRVRDAATAEDVAQEVLRRVLEAIRGDRIRNPAALPAFVFQTAQHVVLQQHRGAGREARALQRLHSAAEGAIASADSLALLISEERRQAVRNALARLGDEDRELLVRLYQDCLDPAELARQLAITPGALRVRKHRALKRLGDLLGEGGR
jgi:RNA polymerase sigma factor (sigma-70 family)